MKMNKGGHEPRNAGGLETESNAPPPTRTESRQANGPQFYSCVGLNSANKLNEQAFPQSLPIKAQPTQHLELGLGRPRAEKPAQPTRFLTSRTSSNPGSFSIEKTFLAIFHMLSTPCIIPLQHPQSTPYCSHSPLLY